MQGFTEENFSLYSDQWWLENPVKKEGGNPRSDHKPIPALWVPRTEALSVPQGLVQLYSHRGGPSTLYALECLHKNQGSPLPSSDYLAFISDEGVLYPPGLQKWPGFLSRFLLIKTKNSRQALQAALETLQTGLFHWIGLRPSAPPQAVELRKLQLACEKNRTLLFLISSTKLPHWLFHFSLEVAYDNQGKTVTNLISTRGQGAYALGRKLFSAYA